MNETFFGGSAAATGDGETVQELASAEGAQETPSADGAPIGATESVGSQETATSVSEAVMPAFGLVRVEPDGSAVIAGSATPSGEVHIFANEDQIGAETAQASGDFAFVTDAPLPTGGVELRILDVETDRFADTSVIVVVQDDRTSEPLVIASAPGEASEILQGLDGSAVAAADDAAPAEPAAEAVPETMAVAEAEAIDPADEPGESPAAPEIAASVEEIAVPQEPVGDEEQPSQTVAAIASASDDIEDGVEEDALEIASASQTPVAPQEDAETAAPQPDAASAEDASAAAEVAPVEAPVSADQPEVAMAPVAEADNAEAPASAPAEAPASAVEPDSDAAPAAGLAPAPSASADAPSEPVTEPQQDVEAPATPAQPAVAAAPQPEVAAPTIDAVEIDGDRNFFAGAGEDGLAVRLYVDNEVVGSTQVSDGRWLIEAIDVLDQQSQRIRIDMLAQDGSVVGRAEVDFILELPAAVNEEIVVAEQGQAEAEDSISAESQDTPVEEVAPVDTPVAPAPAMSDVAEQEPDEVAETIESAEVVEPADTVEPAEPVEPAEAVESAQPAETMEAAAETVPPAETVQSAEAIEPAIPTLVGVSDGTRTATGLAIIRQGDNLWTIARRVYGEGIRYTQIFEANTDQIRNPDLIYPGQVFDLPGTDEVIGEADNGEASSQ
ncbi:MAG: LysM peptidoglycan-binding domain-containing protein [Pelagibacterium sp.]|uniref:LysM peptidoglycan-binding domain-containing protein n=1 Tax=Pelagibacterium sp. TaxID=1967288 RepID=UPI0032F0286B